METMSKTIEIFFTKFEIESGIKTNMCMELEAEGFKLQKDYKCKFKNMEGNVYVYKKIGLS